MTEADTHLEVVDGPIDIGRLYEWAIRADCGAVVVFSGTTRDHSAGRDEVQRLEYEAYEEHVLARFERIVEAARSHWPDVRRIGIVHRVGVVGIGESSVVVIVSSPHRDAAFDAARFGIDTLKATAPIWKREVWRDGESWGLDARDVDDVVPVPQPARSAT